MSLLAAIAVGSPVRAETLVYGGGQWDFESGFVAQPHNLAGQCSHPVSGGHVSCVPSDKIAYVGNGWTAWASFPPPDWTGPPAGWNPVDHWGNADFNENKNLANVSSGIRSQEITATCANGVGLIYRVVSVAVGHEYRFEADAKSTPGSTPANNVQAFMGLDPTGNTDPEAASVQWFPWDAGTTGAFVRTAETIQATGTHITLFIMMMHPVAECVGGTFMVDDVEIYDVGAAAPVIARTPSSFDADIYFGHNAPTQTLSITNVGAATLDYTVTTSATWLTVTPSTGTSTGETDDLDVVFDTDALPSGNYNATITITDANATNSPQTVPVSLTITNQADFDGDIDVDVADFALFQICFSGPANPPPAECIVDADFDADSDVDVADFARFTLCFSGATRSPACEPTP